MKKKLHFYGVHYPVRAVVCRVYTCKLVGTVAPRPPSSWRSAAGRWRWWWWYGTRAPYGGAMVLLLGLHGHGGWCEVGSRLSVGHCWAGAGPSENWRPELLELCSVFSVPRGAGRARIARPQLPARHRGLTSRRPRPRHRAVNEPSWSFHHSTRKGLLLLDSI